MQGGSRILAVRRCPKCVRQLPLDRFYRRLKQSDKLSSYCSECVRDVLSRRRERMRKIHDERSAEDVHEALERDTPINFAALSRNARRSLLAELEDRGWSAAAVAERVGCSVVTVHRHRKSRRAES